MNIFVEKFTNDRIIISGKDVEHLRVRRHRQGDFFKLVETQGDRYADAELVRIENKEAEFTVKKVFNKEKKKIQISLFQAIIKKSNMELVTQKAVELGVDMIIPVITERVSEKGKLNMDRLKIIAKEAAMQSERMDIPIIEETINFAEVLQEKNVFCLGERTKEENMNDFLKKRIFTNNIGVFIGPEGGFTPQEFQKMKDKGIPIVGFGDSILRSETASIASLSVIRCFYLAD